MVALRRADIPREEVAVAIRRFTWREFDQLAELGTLKPQERVELIRGEIVQHMNPQREPHAVSITLSSSVLANAFGARFHVRQEKPFIVGDYSEPEPDIAVVVGFPRDYLPRHPTEAALLVEVADATLNYDTTTKRLLYAEGRIPEYWVVDLRNRVLHVYRRPGANPAAPEGYDYEEKRVLTADAELQPVGAPGVTIKVADLLP